MTREDSAVGGQPGGGEGFPRRLGQQGEQRAGGRQGDQEADDGTEPTGLQSSDQTHGGFRSSLVGGDQQNSTVTKILICCIIWCGFPSTRTANRPVLAPVRLRAVAGGHEATGGARPEPPDGAPSRHRARGQRHRPVRDGAPQPAGSSTPSELAQQLGVTSSAATFIVDRLAALGHVSREPHPGDRRKTVVSPSPESVRRVEGLIRPLATGLADYVASMTPAERTAVEEFSGCGR